MRSCDTWLADSLRRSADMSEDAEDMRRRKDALREELRRLKAAIAELREHHEEEQAMLSSAGATLMQRERIVDSGRDEHDALLRRYRELAVEVAWLRALLPR
jgi:chromosome segregation ATPase